LFRRQRGARQTRRTTMAKGQKRSGREPKKPKANKKKPGRTDAPLMMQGPKGKAPAGP
jgi:hypothetical protein